MQPVPCDPWTRSKSIKPKVAGGETSNFLADNPYTLASCFHIVIGGVSCDLAGDVAEVQMA